MDERKTARRARDRGGAGDRARHGDPGVHERGRRRRTASSSPSTPRRRAPTSATCRRRRWRCTAAKGCCASSSTSPTAPTSRSACSTRRRRATCSRPEESALIANEMPAVCATKEGTLEHWRSEGRARARAGARDLGVRRHRVPGRLVAAGHRRRRAARHLRLPPRDAREADPHRRTGTWSGTVGSPRPSSTRSRPASTGSARRSATGSRGTRDVRTTSPTGVRRSGTRPSVVGLPMGDYPHSRPPQGILPEVAKQQIRAPFERVGFAKQLADA